MTHSEQDKMHQVSRYAVADLGGGAGRAFSVFYFYWVNILSQIIMSAADCQFVSF